MQLTHSLLTGDTHSPILETDKSDTVTRNNLKKSLAYFRDRIGVPRDMSYPAARQLRAHINWLSDQI